MSKSQSSLPFPTCALCSCPWRQASQPPEGTDGLKAHSRPHRSQPRTQVSGSLSRAHARQQSTSFPQTCPLPGACRHRSQQMSRSCWQERATERVISVMELTTLRLGTWRTQKCGNTWQTRHLSGPSSQNNN